MRKTTSRVLASLAVVALVLLAPATVAASEAKTPTVIGWVLELIADIFNSEEAATKNDPPPPPEDEAGGMIVPIG